MISVILSTNNEIQHNYLERIFISLTHQDQPYEIVVVDNNSEDATREICAKYTDKIFILKNSNRAERFNYGLKKVRGEIVVFHHAATLIPHNTFWDIVEVMAQRKSWWCYSHSFDSRHPLLTFTSWYSNEVRVKHKGIVYADHIIFGRRRVFQALWWFPPLDIFEETPFSILMNRRCGKPVLLNHRVVTSARRFKKRGVIRHALLNQYLKILYHMDMSDNCINSRYEANQNYNVVYTKEDEYFEEYYKKKYYR